MPITFSIPPSATVGTQVCVVITGAGAQPPRVVFSGPGSIVATPTPVLTGTVWEVCFVPPVKGTYDVIMSDGPWKTTTGFMVT